MVSWGCGPQVRQKRARSGFSSPQLEQTGMPESIRLELLRRQSPVPVAASPDDPENTRDCRQISKSHTDPGLLAVRWVGPACAAAHAGLSSLAERRAERADVPAVADVRDDRERPRAVHGVDPAGRAEMRAVGQL